jgi:alanine racemase
LKDSVPIFMVRLCLVGIEAPRGDLQAFEELMLEDLVTWAEIDLDAIESNVCAFRNHIEAQVEIFAVVKANAYGHGAVPSGKAALHTGASRLAVHRALEGIELRRAGITAPILLLGYTPPAAADLVIKWQLTPSVITVEFARALSGRAAALGANIPVHIKVDTGMSRYGLMPDEVLTFARALQSLPGLCLEGIFTHFATADWLDLIYTRRQLEIFKEVLVALHLAGIDVPLVHAANTAAIMRLPEAHFNAVRPGLGLYGMTPSDDWAPIFPLHPALSLKSRVSRVRTLPAGSAISYGRTFITKQPTRVALAPIGYGDGFHRAFSNKGFVLIHGQRARILGSVCMDQVVLDVSEIQGVQQDDEIVLLGQQGNETIAAGEIAALIGTINYEITTSLLPRVPRVYLRNGVIVERNEF